MEEILASIRRIISEEDVGQTKADSNMKPAAEEEELVLTKVVAFGHPKDAQSESLKPEQGDNDSEMELAAPDEAGRSPLDTEVEKMPTPTPGLDKEQEPLVSAEVAEASAAAMARLVSSRAHTAVELATPGQGLLVETLVRQAVEPALREWLDNNLQSIVERLVRREIERISRRAELG